MKKQRAEKIMLLVAFFFSGAAALMYEVIWTRAFSLVLGSTVYATSIMLSTFMTGLAIGGWIGGKASRRNERILSYFAWCELLIGGIGIVSTPIIFTLPKLYLSIYREFHLYPSVFFAMQIGLCAIVMLAPTVFMGASFPLLSKRLTHNVAEVGERVGDIYSINTIGAVLGSLAAGFLLIPLLGMNGATLVAGTLNVIIAVFVFVYSSSVSKKGFVAIACFLAVSVALNSLVPVEATVVNFYSSNRFLHPVSYKTIINKTRETRREVFHEEDPQGPVRAFKDMDGQLILQVGGKLEGTAKKDVPNTVLLAYLPVAMHPEPRKFLTIGLGAGITVEAAKENVADLDVVEINAAVVNAVLSHGKPGLLDGVNVIRDDARNYLFRTAKRYDIISSEPSYPTGFEVGSLFTREFYEIAAERLDKNGIYCQWLPYYILSNDDVTVMLRTFVSVFPHAMLWKLPQSMDLILVGSKDPFLSSEERIRERINTMNRSRLPLEYVLSRAPEEISALARRQEIPLNTDDRPLIEFNVVDNILLGDLREKDRKTLYE